MNTHTLPYTKKYLLESLNKHSDTNVNVEFLKTLHLLGEGVTAGAKPPSKTTPTTPSGGAGTGVGTSSGDKPDILFGSKTTGFGKMSPAASAAGLYMGGKALETAADFLDSAGIAGKITTGMAAAAGKMLPKSISSNPILGGAASSILGGALGTSTGIVSAMLRNIADASGASYFEKNLQNIGNENVRNVVSGAGKPFARLLVPERDISKEELSSYGPEKERAKALGAAKAAEEVKRYRGMGYSIP